VEQDKALAAAISRTQQQLQATAVSVQHGNGIALLQQQAPNSLDLIFLDPPFDAALFVPALERCAKVLSAKGWVYLEAPQPWTDEQLAPFHLTIYRHLKAGAVHAHLLRPVASAANAND